MCCFKANKSVRPPLSRALHSHAMVVCKDPGSEVKGAGLQPGMMTLADHIIFSNLSSHLTVLSML